MSSNSWTCWQNDCGADSLSATSNWGLIPISYNKPSLIPRRIWVRSTKSDRLTSGYDWTLRLGTLHSFTARRPWRTGRVMILFESHSQTIRSVSPFRNSTITSVNVPPTHPHYACLPSQKTDLSLGFAKNYHHLANTVTHLSSPWVDPQEAADEWHACDAPKFYNSNKHYGDHILPPLLTKCGHIVPIANLVVISFDNHISHRFSALPLLYCN